MQKKAQSQIITTVLIILLVLAAIVIVWQVVNSTVSGGAEEIDKQSSCIGLSMEVTRAVATETTVTVRRGPGSDTTVVTGYKVFINGAQSGADDTTDLTPLATDKFVTPALVSGNDVEVAPILSDGTVCAATGSATVA